MLGEVSGELEAIVDGLAAKVGAPVAQRDFARWTMSPPRNGSWEAEIALLKEFLRKRATWITNELQRW